MKHLIIAFSVLALLVFTGGSARAYQFPPHVEMDDYDSVGDTIPTPYDNLGYVNPDISDAVNRILGTAYVSNEFHDSLFVGNDSEWYVFEPGARIALLGMTAGNSNTMGFYQTYPTTNDRTNVIGPYGNVFSFLAAGTSDDPYPAQNIPLAVGEEFKWFVRSVRTNTPNPYTNYYYSEPGIGDTSDIYDHMMTFRLPFDEMHNSIWVSVNGGTAEQWLFTEPYLLVWEDKPWQIYYDGSQGGDTHYSGQYTLGDEDYNDMIYIVDRVRPVPEPSTWLLLGSGLFGLVVFGIRRNRRA